LLQQFGMAASFGNGTIVYHYNFIGMLYGTESVSNHYAGAVLHQPGKGFLHLAF
jgi:hypothetical protein